MTMHPRNNIDRLYVSRKEGGRGLAITDDRFDISIKHLEDYVKKNKERQIIATRNDTNNTRINRTTITRKEKKIGRKAIV